MKKQSLFSRSLGWLLIIGLSIFALAPAHAADAPKVTAGNYVRAESDIQMKGYIESFDILGKFHSAEVAVYPLYELHLAVLSVETLEENQDVVQHGKTEGGK